MAIDYGNFIGLLLLIFYNGTFLYHPITSKRWSVISLRHNSINCTISASMCQPETSIALLYLNNKRDSKSTHSNGNCHV